MLSACVYISLNFGAMKLPVKFSFLKKLVWISLWGLLAQYTAWATSAKEESTIETKMAEVQPDNEEEGAKKSKASPKEKNTHPPEEADEAKNKVSPQEGSTDIPDNVSAQTPLRKKPRPLEPAKIVHKDPLYALDSHDREAPYRDNPLCAFDTAHRCGHRLW